MVCLLFKQINLYNSFKEVGKCCQQETDNITDRMVFKQHPKVFKVIGSQQKKCKVSNARRSPLVRHVIGISISHVPDKGVLRSPEMLHSSAVM